MLDQAVVVDCNRFSEQILSSLGGVSAQVAFSDFGTNNFAGTGHAEAFGRSLMSFNFVLSTTLFTWHDQTPLRKSNGCEQSQPLVDKPISNYTRKMVLSIKKSYVLIPLWSEHHEHCFAFHIGGLFNFCYVAQLFRDFSQIFQCQFRVGNFPTSKADGNPYLHATFQPTARVAHFKALVMITGFWAQTNLLDLDLGLRFSGFAFLLFLLVKELAVVDDLTNGWVSIGGDFHQVQTGVVCAAQGVVNAYYSNVFPVFVNKADLICADAFINTMFLFTTDCLFLLN